MARPETGQDEFVDLYAVLEIPENVGTEEIRKRINALYIEAQQNLDHRNVKKRLQFQQMYEIFLPQARHLLMDDARRAEYNRYLNAFRTGSKLEAVAEPNAPIRSNTGVVEGELGGAPGRPAVGLPELVEEVDPETLAVEREAMWAKWKTGLETISEDAPSEIPVNALSSSGASAPSTPPVSAPPVPSTPGAVRARPAPVVPRFQPPPPSSNRPQPGGAARAPGTPLTQPSASSTQRPVSAQAAQPAHGTDPSGEIEKKREQQRYQLIKASVQNAGLMWGAGTAVAVFLLGCIALLIIDTLVKSYPFGMGRSVFVALCFLTVILASLASGFSARKRAKRRAVAELSVMSIEELMRRSG